jgi:hypothetical protein
MNEPPAGRVFAKAILATDHEIPAYNGFRLSVDALRQLANAVMGGGMEMLVQHDLSRPLNASDVHAEVRWNEQGWHEVLLEFEADEEAWNQFEAERIAAGAPGGMSFSFFAPLSRAGTGDRPTIVLGGDAHHFSPADLEEAGTRLLPLADVELKELFQFSHEPLAKVVVEYGWEVLKATPPDMLASFLADALRGLIGKRRDAGGKTVVDFIITETEDERVVRATVTTDSDEVAIKAIEALGRLGVGRYRWDDEREDSFKSI